MHLGRVARYWWTSCATLAVNRLGRCRSEPGPGLYLELLLQRKQATPLTVATLMQYVSHRITATDKVPEVPWAVVPGVKTRYDRRLSFRTSFDREGAVVKVPGVFFFI